jgi:hypothetical protein
MAVNDYHFISDWHVPGTPAECYDIIYDALSLPLVAVCLRQG